MDLPKTIDELIERMDTMLEEAIRTKNPLGLFTALYQRVTIRVKEGILTGRFEDGPRMEKLDVVFANRYLEAYDQYVKGKGLTASWKATFDVTADKNLILIQHLLLGMNAHINLDLGIAVAEISEGQSLEAIKNDFQEINQILFDMIEEIQMDIGKVSPLFGLIDILAKDKDEQFAEFSMKTARKHAWIVAQRMSLTNSTNKAETIEKIDRYVLSLNKLILKPGWLLSIVIWLVRLVESKDIVKNIKALCAKN